jgi:hypothetical protein
MIFLRAVSFHILDFADLFQLGFALDDNLGDLDVVCFSAERIQLAAEFLADDLKRSPDGRLLVCRFEELIQMRFRAGSIPLRNQSARRKKSRLLSGDHRRE